MPEPAVRPLDRRSLIVAGAGALATTLAAGSIAAQGHPEGHHAGHAAIAYTPPEHPELIRSALDCVRTGDVCLDHCYQTFQAGDTSLAECARRLQALVATCTALARLASLDAAHLADFAAATAKTCRHCEEECRRHAAHKPCLDCAESCAACAKECDRLRA